ncbi:MAG TPA: ATP-binding protein [Myxococcales bacterium]|nr:ATP-binding protein [Myxococcales bacterium]
MRVRKVEQICEELARTVGAASDSCVVAWDDGAAPRIVFATGDTQKVLLAKAGELVGRPASSLFSGGERAARDLAALCANVPVSEERPMMRAGKPFAAQLLLRGVSGGAIALVRDLTAGQQQTDAALRAEDLARFASLVAHEVRNPLSAVKIALQTLERHGALTPNDLKRTSIALREVLNIELLLNEVLEFARPPSLSLVPADPRGPVEEAVAGVEIEWAARGVTFTRSVPSHLPPASIDPVRVRTAAKILCRQAAVAAEEAGGGAVEVVLRELPRGWELSVADAGRTLAPDLREKAFVPFTPQRARGSGLGLAVVARIAREHGGGARIEERPGGGNVISLTFPA